MTFPKPLTEAEPQSLEAELLREGREQKLPVAAREAIWGSIAANIGPLPPGPSGPSGSGPSGSGPSGSGSSGPPGSGPSGSGSGLGAAAAGQGTLLAGKTIAVLVSVAAIGLGGFGAWQAGLAKRNEPPLHGPAVSNTALDRDANTATSASELGQSSAATPSPPSADPSAPGSGTKPPLADNTASRSENTASRPENTASRSENTASRPRNAADLSETPRRPNAAERDATAPLSATSALREESSLLLEARAALRSGSVPAALELLNRARARFPRGALVQEREALQIEALARSGQSQVAAKRAAAFLQQYPRSPHASDVHRYLAP